MVGAKSLGMAAVVDAFNEQEQHIAPKYCNNLLV